MHFISLYFKMDAYYVWCSAVLKSNTTVNILRQETVLMIRLPLFKIKVI